MSRTITGPITVKEFEDQLHPYEQLEYLRAAEQVRTPQHPEGIPSNLAVQKSMGGALRELGDSKFTVEIPDIPADSPTTRQRAGGGRFFIPTPDDPRSEGYVRAFNNSAQLKAELKTRRELGEDEGEDGFYGLIPYAEYESQQGVQRLLDEAAAKKRLDENIDNLGIREDVETTQKAPSTPGTDTPVEEDKDDVSEQARKPKAGPLNVPPVDEAPVEPDPVPPQAEPASPPVSTDQPVSDTGARGEPEEPLVLFDSEEELQEFLGKLDKLKGGSDKHTESESITLEGPLTARPGEAEASDIISLERSEDEAPLESTDEPDLADVELEERPDPGAPAAPPAEAAAEDPAASEIPPLPEAEEDGLTAEEIAVLAAKEFPDNGMEYLEPIFEASVFKHKYNADDPRDRAQMEFLINFFIREGLPLTPTIEAGLGKKAADEFFGAEEAK